MFVGGVDDVAVDSILCLLLDESSASSMSLRILSQGN
jgi:hypothetical protein